MKFLNSRFVRLSIAVLIYIQIWMFVNSLTYNNFISMDYSRLTRYDYLSGTTIILMAFGIMPMFINLFSLAIFITFLFRYLGFRNYEFDDDSQNKSYSDEIYLLRTKDRSDSERYYKHRIIGTLRLSYFFTLIAMLFSIILTFITTLLRF